MKDERRRNPKHEIRNPKRQPIIRPPRPLLLSAFEFRISNFEFRISSLFLLHPSPMPTRIGLYAGSFDPVTLGHLDIIRRGARLVD